MNERGIPRDASWKKPKRQMPARESGGGDASSPHKQTIHEKELGEDTLPERRTLRGVETTGTTLEQRHPDWPRKIEVTICLTPHATFTDGTIPAKHMAETDIYLPEDPLGINALYYQDCADDGLTYPDGAWSKTSFSDAIALSLLGSKIKIGRFDLMPDDEITGEQIKESYFKQYIVQDFHETLDNLRKKKEHTAELQQKREEIMMNRFEPSIEDLLERYPELKNKPELKILISLGSSHTPLAHKMKSEGITVITKFSSKPEIYSYGEEVKRSFEFGNEPDDDLLAKAHFEAIIRQAFYNLSLGESISSGNLISYYREIISQFTTKEIKEAHTIFLKTSPQSVEIAVDQVLGNKGLEPLPRTIAELESVVEKFQREEKEAAEARLAEYRRTHSEN